MTAFLLLPSQFVWDKDIEFTIENIAIILKETENWSHTLVDIIAALLFFFSFRRLQ